MTVASAIHGSRSSRRSAAPASSVNTFVSGVTAAIRNTCDRGTCEAPRTSIVRAAKNGLRVSVTAAAPSTTTVMNTIAPTFRSRSRRSAGCGASASDVDSAGRGISARRGSARRPSGRPPRRRSGRRSRTPLARSRRPRSSRRAAQRRASSNAPISLHLGLQRDARTSAPRAPGSRGSARGRRPIGAPGSATMKFACFVETDGASDPSALAPRRLDQTGRVVALRVREDAPAVRLGERLGPAAPLARLVHRVRGSGPHRPRAGGRRRRSPRRRPPGSDRRYANPASAASTRLGATLAQTGTSGCARATSAIAPPWAPAFIRTAPPSVAGIATPNSRPARP